MTLRQMRDHAAEAVELARNKSREDLEESRLLNLALTRLVEVVGEAASRVPADARLQFPSIPWREVLGLRNRLIHAYDRVDLAILWQVVRYDLPALVAELDRILANESRG